MRILVDTNVFLDFLLNRENANDAIAFFNYCAKLKNQIYVSTISLRDIGYVTHHFYHDADKAKKAQLSVYGLCSKIIDITADDAINSLYSDMSDFEDSLQLEAADRSMLDLIVTNNIKDYAGQGFPALTVKQINEIFDKTLSYKPTQN